MQNKNPINKYLLSLTENLKGDWAKPNCFCATKAKLAIKQQRKIIILLPVKNTTDSFFESVVFLFVLVKYFLKAKCEVMAFAIVKFCPCKVKLSVPLTPAGTSRSEASLHAPQVCLSCEQIYFHSSSSN